MDNTQLAITERQGVEIDYCPQCRGVWLDRGELDKIIEKSEAYTNNAEPSHRPEPRQYNQSHYDDRDDQRHHKKRGRESFLGDLFDF